MSIRSGLTVSLVEEARKGPFVFHGDLRAACEAADKLDIDAVEVFPRSPEDLEANGLRGLLDEFALNLAAVGSGAGWLKHKLSLSDRDPGRRAEAVRFVCRMLDAAHAHGAPVIIGSMQGQVAADDSRDEALKRLAESLNAVDEHASPMKAGVLIEPLNRYESNLLNTLADAKDLILKAGATHSRVLADMFHMAIEEADMAAALTDCGPRLGHVHFADSNRRAPGMGHTQFGPIIDALVAVEYQGFLSAEVFPLPDGFAAAQATAKAFRRWVPAPTPSRF